MFTPFVSLDFPKVQIESKLNDSQVEHKISNDVWQTTNDVAAVQLDSPRKTQPSMQTVDRNSIPPSQEVSTTDGGHTFLYLPKEEIKQVGMIDKTLYKEAINQLPICCVDTFLFNPTERTYLLVLRKDPPAKGIWWLPGGRFYKGETIFACSERKCKDEVGLEVTAVKNLDFTNTIFPDSMWNTQTHTVNFLVLATLKNQTNPTIDTTCEEYQWKDINCPPEDPYVLKAYDKALTVIRDLNI